MNSQAWPYVVIGLLSLTSSFFIASASEGAAELNRCHDRQIEILDDRLEDLRGLQVCLESRPSIMMRDEADPGTTHIAIAVHGGGAPSLTIFENGEDGKRSLVLYGQGGQDVLSVVDGRVFIDGRLVAVSGDVEAAIWGLWGPVQ